MTTQFRRTGQRDERRRRMLIEETNVRDQASESSRSSSGGASSNDPEAVGRALQPRYPSATLSERQPLLVAAIPTGWGAVISVVGLLLATIAGLEAAYGYVALGHTSFSLGDLPAIDLMSRASIASWSSSIILILAAQIGILTYFIRRHRVDDYRGRYRMWYWVVPILLAAALDQVADLQYSVRSALLIVAGIPQYADARMIWMSVLAVLTVVVLVRLAIEIRDSRLALLSLLVASSCYAAASAAGLRWILVEDTVFRVMATAGLRLGGHAALFMAIMFNARYVYRDAEGRIRHVRRRRRQVNNATNVQPASNAKPKRPRKTRVVRHDPAHSAHAKKQSSKSSEKKAARSAVGTQQDKTAATQKSRHAGRAATKSTELKLASPAVAPHVPAEHETPPRKLTKAERRKLRKQRRQQRQEAA